MAGAQFSDIYDGVEILDVKFLTPARIRLKSSLGEDEANVQIDVINRRVYDHDEYDPKLTDLIFKHLDAVNNLPEDFFQASEDIYERAVEAHAEHERLRKEHAKGDV